jgi:hypothetical protein
MIGERVRKPAGELWVMFVIFWAGPPPGPVTFQLKVTEPRAPVESWAVTVTV